MEKSGSRIAMSLLAAAGLISGCTINPTPVGFEPVPEKPGEWRFSSDLTATIVQKLHCEARDAMLDIAVGFLQSSSDFLDYGYTRQILENYRKDPTAITKAEVWDFHPVAQTIASFFGNSTVKMKFILTGYESNTGTIQASLNPSGGTNPVSLKINDHSSQLERKNKRTIDEDSFSFYKLNEIDCPQDNHQNYRFAYRLNNFNYPLTGNIDLIKPVFTFVRYTLSNVEDKRNRQIAEAAIHVASLEIIKKETKNKKSIENQISYFKSGEFFSICEGDYEDKKYKECMDKKEKSKTDIKETVKQFVEYGYNISECKLTNYNKIKYGAEKLYKDTIAESIKIYNNFLYNYGKIIYIKSPAMQDELQFTTTLNGGLNPSISFANIGSFKPKTLGVNFSNKRTDTHELTLALAAPAAISYKPKEEPEQVKIGGEKGYEIYVKFPPGVTPPKGMASGKPDSKNRSTSAPAAISSTREVKQTGPFLYFDPTPEEKQNIQQFQDRALSDSRVLELIDKIENQ